MLSPIRGRVPCRAEQCFTEKAPNPAILTDSPLARASEMAVSTASTAAAASAFESEVSVATCPEISDFFIPLLPAGEVGRSLAARSRPSRRVGCRTRTGIGRGANRQTVRTGQHAASTTGPKKMVSGRSGVGSPGAQGGGHACRSTCTVEPPESASRPRTHAMSDNGRPSGPTHTRRSTVTVWGPRAQRSPAPPPRRAETESTESARSPEQGRTERRRRFAHEDGAPDTILSQISHCLELKG